MSPIPQLAWLMTGCAIAMTIGCSAPREERRDENPFEPQPADTTTPATPDTVAGSLRGYGFSPSSGVTALSVTANGTDSATCSSRASGNAVLILPVSAGLKARLDQNRVAKGRVYVQPISQYTFVGRGVLSYAEEARLLLAPNTIGSKHNAHQVTGPVQSVVGDVTSELPIDAGLPRVGDTLRLDVAAQVAADLGAECGQSVAGFARWRLRGAILWLVE